MVATRNVTDVNFRRILGGNLLHQLELEKISDRRGGGQRVIECHRYHRSMMEGWK